MTCNDYLPKMLFQNPAISGDRYGWVNCTAYAAAMAGAFHTCGSVIMSGSQVRSQSNEPVPDPSSPGLNLSQVDAVLNRHGIDLDIEYRYAWDDFARRIDEGQGAILQINTGALIGTTFQSTAGPVNHAIFVPPGWGAMDPAADGRKAYHKYDGKPYPKSLLKEAAGMLVVGYHNDHALHVGTGLVYAAFTKDNRVVVPPTQWVVSIKPKPPATRKAFSKLTLNTAKTRVATRSIRHTHGFKATCSKPIYVRSRTGLVVKVTKITSGVAHRGWWVNARYAKKEPV